MDYNTYRHPYPGAFKHDRSGKKEYVSYIKYKINFPVNKTGLIQYELKKENILIIEKKFNNEDVEFIIGVPENSIEKLERIITPHSNVVLAPL